jgi:hypothetical protein
MSRLSGTGNPRPRPVAGHRRSLVTVEDGPVTDPDLDGELLELIEGQFQGRYVRWREGNTFFSGVLNVAGVAYVVKGTCLPGALARAASLER